MGFSRRRDLRNRGPVLSQRRLLQETQNRLNNLLWKVMKARIQKRENADFFDELMTRSLAHMITRGLPIQPLGTGTPAITTTTMATVNPEWEVEENLCLDLSGRDRVCCNTASYCFNGLHNGVINVQDSKNDFSLMSACRQVQDELKKDQFCVRKSLSPCQGHGRALLQNRFKNRVDTLYDQFYKHCRRRNTTTVPGVPPAVPATQSPTSNTPGVTTTPVRPPGVPDANGSGHTHGNHSPTSGSGAILAGALTGGIVLALVLFVAVVFWCKNRADRNESGSSDSRGIFFQKRQNMFSTEKPRNNNNNRAVTRQDSCEYAEIDDCMIAPHMPANLVNAGYIHPIGDEEGMIQSVSGHSPHPSRSASVPMVTTRGQLSYGPILAANNNSRSTKPAFYHSTSVASPRELQSMNIGSISETILHPQNLPLSDIAEIREGIGESEFQHSDLEEYEEPVSTNSSLRYTQLDTVDIPPQDLAPDVPQKPSSQPSTPIQGRVRVLPSNPSSPSLRSLSVPNTPPIAKPRRKTASKALKPLASEIKRDSVEAEGKPPVTDTANRDSVMSAKSSHHYFVLEPNENSEYENSISPPKYV